MEVVDKENALQTPEGDVGGVEGIKVKALNGLCISLAPHLLAGPRVPQHESEGRVQGGQQVTGRVPPAGGL